MVLQLHCLAETLSGMEVPQHSSRDQRNGDHCDGLKLSTDRQKRLRVVHWMRIGQAPVKNDFEQSAASIAEPLRELGHQVVTTESPTAVSRFYTEAWPVRCATGAVAATVGGVPPDRHSECLETSSQAQNARGGHQAGHPVQQRQTREATPSARTSAGAAVQSPGTDAPGARAAERAQRQRARVQTVR